MHADRQPGAQFGLEYSPEVRVGAIETDVSVPLDGDERRTHVGTTGRSHVDTTPWPRAGQARLDKVTVGRCNRIPMQSEQLLGTSYAGKSAARPDLPAEDA